MEGHMKNCVRNAQDQVTLVHIMGIHLHFILDFEWQCGSICLRCDFSLKLLWQKVHYFTTKSSFTELSRLLVYLGFVCLFVVLWKYQSWIAHWPGFQLVCVGKGTKSKYNLYLHDYKIYPQDLMIYHRSESSYTFCVKLNIKHHNLPPQVPKK